jgi:hypothetical protein
MFTPHFFPLSCYVAPASTLICRGQTVLTFRYGLQDPIYIHNYQAIDITIGDRGGWVWVVTSDTSSDKDKNMWT